MIGSRSYRQYCFSLSITLMVMRALIRNLLSKARNESMIFVDASVSNGSFHRHRLSMHAGAGSITWFSSAGFQDDKKSRRQQFNEIPVHPSLLQHIESIGVGIKPRRRPKRRNARQFVVERPQVRPVRGQRAMANTQAVTSSKPLKTSSKPLKTSSKPLKSMLPPPPFGPYSRVRVVASCTNPAEFPANRKKIAEVAIAGRSNVGKSTLLNALLYGNRKLVKDEDSRPSRGRTVDAMKLPKGVKATMSNRPGETKAITFYELTTKQNAESQDVGTMLWLVDLPGYGFAFAAGEDAATFHKLMADYILQRGSLKRVLLLIDARHGLKTADYTFLSNLESHSNKLPPMQLVLTKCDLVSQPDLARRVSQVRQQVSHHLRREPGQLPVMLVSARANHLAPSQPQGGVLELQKDIASLGVKSDTRALK